MNKDNFFRLTGKVFNIFSRIKTYGQNGVAGSTSGCGQTLFGEVDSKASTEKIRAVQNPVSLSSNALFTALIGAFNGAGNLSSGPFPLFFSKRIQYNKEVLR